MSSSLTVTKDNGLSSVLGSTLENPTGGNGTESEPLEWTINVASSVTEVGLNDIECTTLAGDWDAELYSDEDFSGSASNIALSDMTVIYIKSITTGDIARYHKVTINRLSDAKAITAFSFNGLTPNVIGTVNEAAKTIALTVPYGTDVTALVPTITHTGASISPNTGEAKNFTYIL